MLTVDEIEDSFEVHFRQQVEDLPDEVLHAMLHDMRTLRRYAPPSLAASLARDIVAEILRARTPPEPAPAPEPEPEPQSEPEPVMEATPEPEAAVAPPPESEPEPEPEPVLAREPEPEPAPVEAPPAFVLPPSLTEQPATPPPPPRSRRLWWVLGLGIAVATLAAALLL